MVFLELENLTKYFGQTVAVDHVSLSIQQGELLTLLGPSGCGKTTLLRMIAGFEIPSEGRILLDGEEITHRAASKRAMGVVFQSYALFPHLTAEQNIAFGMQMKGLPGNQIRQRCRELLALVGLDEVGRRYPHQLSGGQQQRIALARALAIEPKMLLLDEPLSALDARVRVMLRNEIRRIQQRLGITAIYVTHDQEEALAISDRIAVMTQGRIEQLDHPEEIYGNPKTAFAATFVGVSNQFKGIVKSAVDGLCQVQVHTFRVPSLAEAGHRDGDTVLLVVRPEEVSLRQHSNGATGDTGSEEANRIQGMIELRTFLGPFTRFHVHIGDDITLIADIPSQQARSYETKQTVTLSFPSSACQVLPLQVRDGATPPRPGVL
ncbi:MAG: ABC transporter ATP-binding protein [Ktedonobacteraceae bacterium]|nr:ABC transporter ATP-binding protein [Ktedonobacteraceae bacterium]